MADTIPDVRYEACWTEDDGIYGCGCDHRSIAEAMACLRPDGRSFIRRFEGGISTSLCEMEMGIFILELGKLRGSGR